MPIRAHTRDVLNSPELLAAREGHMARLSALYAGEALAEAFILWGYRGKGQCNPYREPERWVFESLDDLAEHAGLLDDPRVFRPLTIEFGPYGVHFIDKILGAEVFDLDGTGNWQVHPLQKPVGSLEPPDLGSDPTWALARRAALAFLEARVSVPLFGLPTIASALNVAVNLYGGRILEAMLTDPDGARHDLKIINELLCALHRHYLGCMPLAQLQPVVADKRTQPPGHGQLCGCTTQLVSREQYAELVAPLDDTLLALYPHGGMIHLCGAHVQHNPTWRAMLPLRAVQMNDRAAEDLARYHGELRGDQILYVNTHDRMLAGRALEITGGRRMVLVADPEKL